MSAPRHFGLIGLGAMGWPIAQTAAAAGAQVEVFDVSEAARERARAAGLTTHDDVRSLAAACSTVVLSLPTPAIVESVVAELAPAGGIVVLDTSTIDAATARRCRDRLVASGGDYADCPVLGRPERVGQWTLPVGGSDAAYARAAQVLEPLARAVPHVGDVGAASAVKVLNNLMLGAINAVTAEVLVLAEAAGLDPGVFVDVVLDSGAASVSGLFKDVGPRAVDGDFAPTFSLRLMHKDNALAIAMAEEYGVPLLVGSAAQTLNTMGMAAGHGDEDSIAVVRALEKLTGRSARRHGGSARSASVVVGEPDAG
ncbi:MAG TPA: NAD(P)-dependent oxidoreductase [Angustibacter sp.]|nr:NAD(P)-dependent oxidoreductase [Angustibacter sp.]